MTRTHDKRIDRVQEKVDTAPVHPHLLEEAYDWFTSFGELPDDDHVAFEVVQRALRGGEDHWDTGPRLPFRKRPQPRDEWPPSVRSMLFDEALDKRRQVREIARAAIALEVAYGADVENPAFGARHGIPCYGFVGMQMLDMPRKLAVPPYEHQAKRVFVRLDMVRGRVERQGPDWFEAQVEAEVELQMTGALPKGQLHLEALLVTVELDLLRANQRGKDVAAALGLLDRIATATGSRADQRPELLAELSKLAASGGLLR